MRWLFSLLALPVLTGMCSAYTDDATHPLTYTGSSGSLAASAAFTFSSANGGTLQLILKNTGAPAVVNGDILNGLFWTSTTTLSAANGSALLGSSHVVDLSGGSVVQTTAPAGGDVGKKFDYSTSASWSKSVGSFNNAISGAGYITVNGDSGNLGTATMVPGGANNNQAYGIVSDIDLNAHNKVNSIPLIKDSVTFTFTNVGTSFNITALAFQYGTSLSETRFDGTPSTVPEPASYLGALAVSFAGLLLSTRRRTAA